MKSAIRNALRTMEDSLEILQRSASRKKLLLSLIFCSYISLYHRQICHTTAFFLIIHLGVCPEDHIDVRNVTCIPDLHNCIGNHRCRPERLQEIIGLNQDTLLPRTLCSLEHFTPQNAFLLSTLCFLKYDPPWNTLLNGDFSSLRYFALKATCSRK